MRNLILLTVLIFTFSSNTIAQKWSMGVYGGAGVSGMIYRGQLPKNSVIALRPTAGLTFQRNWEDFAVRGDIFYDGMGLVKSDTIHQSYEYLTASISMVALLGNKKNIYLGVGPYLSYLMSYMERYTNLTNSVNGIDGGISFVFGGRIRLNKTVSLLLESYTAIGLGNVARKVDDTDRLTHFKSSLRVGISLNLK